MAKIPITLEAGTADGKLAESQAIYDSILKQFQSDINGEYKLTKQQVAFLLPIVERLNDVQDTLTSIEADKPLSAQQGKILKELLDTKVIESGAVPMDSEPTKGNIDHVVTSDGIHKSFNKVNDKINLSKDEESIYPSDIFNQINTDEYIYVQLDSNNKLIFGILPNGDIVYAFGVSSQIKDYIESIKTELLNKINDAATKTELTIAITGITENLNKKVDKEEGKELIDSEVNSTKCLYENGKYISIEIDESGHLLEARLLNGTKVIYTNIETQSISIETDNNPEFIELHLDNNNKLLYGITSTGDFIFGIGVPSKIQESINNIVIEQTTVLTDAINNLTESLNIEKQRALMAEEQLALKLSKLNYEYDENNNIIKLGNKRYKLIEDGTITDYDFYILSFETKDNPDYKYVITDKNNVILYSEKQDGTIFKAELDDPVLLDIVEHFIENPPINLKDYVLSVQKDIENPEYKVVYLDESNKILYSINVDDVIYNPDITHNSTTDESITGKDLSYAINYMESKDRPQKNIEYE